MPSESEPGLSLILQAAHLAASGQGLQMGNRAAGPVYQARLAAEQTRLTRELEAANELVHALFPQGIPLDTSLYERLSRFRFHLGLAGPIEEIVAAAWVATLRSLNEENQKAALRAFTQSGQAFFAIHNTLAEVVAAVPLQPSFVAEWFPALLHRLENDGAAYGVWNAVDRYCETSPPGALGLLETCEAAVSSDLHAKLAQRIVGTLRTVTMELEVQQRFAAIAADLESSIDPARRLLFFRSWIHTAARGGMSREELEKLLAAPGTTQELDARFSIVCEILTAPRLNSECFAVAFEWVRLYARPELSHAAKNQLVITAFWLESKRAERPALPDFWGPLAAIQPIAPERVDTWARLQDYLVSLMNADPAVFEDKFLELCERSGAQIVHLIQTGEALAPLLSAMTTRIWEKLVMRLMFASRPLSRRIALFLFEELGIKTFPHDLLAAVTEQDLRLALFAFEAASPHGSVIPRFLLAILPRVKTASAEMQADFKEELLLQAKNYPEACLAVLKRSRNRSTLVRDVIIEAEVYFGTLRNSRESPLNSMRVPALESVARSKRRAIHRDITQTAEQNSILSLLAKSVDVLYGEGFCHFHDGQVSDTTPMQEHRYNMEFPRLEEIDPELMAMRRWHALEMISRLENEKLARP